MKCKSWVYHGPLSSVEMILFEEMVKDCIIETIHLDHVKLSFDFYLSSDSCLSLLTNLIETSSAANLKMMAWPSATKFQIIGTCIGCAMILQHHSQTTHRQINHVSTGTSTIPSAKTNQQIPSREPYPSTILVWHGLQFFRSGCTINQSVKLFAYLKSLLCLQVALAHPLACFF